MTPMEALGSKQKAVGRILVLDDEPNILSAIRRLIRPTGHEAFCFQSGSKALEFLSGQEVEVIISDMRMPEMDGAEFLSKASGLNRESARILLTGFADMESTVRAINNGSIQGYLSKPWDDKEMLFVIEREMSRVLMARDNERLRLRVIGQNALLEQANATLEEKVVERTKSLADANSRLKQNFLVSMKMFSGLIEMRDGSMAGHSRRVGDLSRRMAGLFSMQKDWVQDVFLAGLLHDIGKIGLSDRLVRARQGSVSPEDAMRYRTHPDTGADFLMPIPELANAAAMVRTHHERPDGKGVSGRVKGRADSIGGKNTVLCRLL